MGKKKDSLGRSLIKDMFSKNRNKKRVEDNSMLHTTEVHDGYDWGRLNLQSVTAESSLQEFLSTAELAQREFTAEKLNIKYVKSMPKEVEAAISQPDFDEPMTVPRRPKWHEGVTAEEQFDKERESFLNWRRHLNELETKLGAAVTPYERNLELWRQLWRTLEKSDIVLILLDARNPLLFRCADLEQYASQENCKCILLLNKADLTSEYERKCWAEYFNKLKVPIIFFSAAPTTAKDRKISEQSETPSDNKDETDHESIKSNENTSENDEVISNSDEKKDYLLQSDADLNVFKERLLSLESDVNNTANKLEQIQQALDKVVKDLNIEKREGTLTNHEQSVNSVNIEPENQERGDNTTKIDNSDPVNNSEEIFDRTRLLDVLKAMKVDKLKNPPRIIVGMIGYPNVGKSSTVNVLMRSKKVSVSSMPGHTRYIQSLLLDNDVTLLDCPGLVLPAYAVTADLLLTAVLPIDQMRSHDAAIARLCQLVGRHTFASKYGLLLPQDGPNETDYKQILTAHAFNRGFMTAAGQPDVSRSARLLLKDAAAGRLRWEQLPPGCSPQPVDDALLEAKENRKPTPREARAVVGWLNKSAEVDKAFFAMDKSTVHMKGKPVVGISGTEQPATGLIRQLMKPWKLEKKHANKNKREKLRRVYSHLDDH